MHYSTISETVAAYNEFLNEAYDWPRIAGITFEPSTTLERIDPIAYKCGWLDWCDAEGIDTDELDDDYTFERDRL